MAVVTLRVFLARYNAEVIVTLPEMLTSTEISILRMLLQGMSITEIALRRCRSMKTISCQKAKLYKKLGTRDDLTLWQDLLFRNRITLCFYTRSSGRYGVLSGDLRTSVMNAIRLKNRSIVQNADFLGGECCLVQRSSPG